MPTKSEVVFQRALHFKDQICELPIKHIEEQEKFAMVVCEIFGNTFRDEIAITYDSSGKAIGEEEEWDGEEERRDEGRDRRDDYNDNCNPMTR